MSNPNVASAVNKLFKRRSEFVVIGLTGRTGSECSTTADLFGLTFAELKAPPSATNEPDAEERKYRIAREYAAHHWAPFHSISVSKVILSFLLNLSEGELIHLLSNAPHKLKSEQIDQLLPDWRPAAESWQLYKNLLDTEKKAEQKLFFLNAWGKEIDQFSKTVRQGLGPTSNKLLQIVGDNLRKSGSALSAEYDPDNFFNLPDRVVSIIETIHAIQASNNQPTYVVIDALRNPFEVLYFRERFSSFYLFAITTENKDRLARLSLKDFSPAQISELDKKEYPDKNKPLSGYDSFTSQNIQSCLEKADVYIGNNGSIEKTQQPDLTELTKQLIRYFVLAIHPGLITPTRNERCMQIAFTARANSGCISRQVGAVITDKNYSVKAIGWNDVPAGQVPCLLRSATDLDSRTDKQAFSLYEFNTTEFRNQVQGSYKKFSLVQMGGRSAAFCFKCEFNALKDESNQVHTRSLHAEENAFLQIAKYGGGGMYGGNLYTTASPCELCAKKSFQLGIKKILYVDPYPGISMDHILQSGEMSARPTVELYQGAVGQAYHRLYDPILPFKDEIKSLMEGAEAAPVFGPPLPQRRSDQLF